eukprot:jgi/Mesen1/8829/ME000053S08234
MQRKGAHASTYGQRIAILDKAQGWQEAAGATSASTSPLPGGGFSCANDEDVRRGLLMTRGSVFAPKPVASPEASRASQAPAAIEEDPAAATWRENSDARPLALLAGLEGEGGFDDTADDDGSDNDDQEEEGGEEGGEEGEEEGEKGEEEDGEEVEEEKGEEPAGEESLGLLAEGEEKLAMGRAGGQSGGKPGGRESAGSKSWSWAGHEIKYVAEGSGPAVVLVHGFGASIGHFRKNIPVLSESYTVYALDLLGQGGSAKPPNFVYTIEAWAEVHIRPLPIPLQTSLPRP